MADILMYISKDNTQNYPFYRLKLVVETLNLINQPIKIHYSPQNCKANELENVIIGLWGLL